MRILIKNYKFIWEVICDLRAGYLIYDKEEPSIYYKYSDGVVSKYKNYIETSSSISVNNIQRYYSRRGLLEQTKVQSQGCNKRYQTS